MNQTESPQSKTEINYIIELMNIYLSEWEYRSKTLWNQVFRFFYATIVVLFLPNVAAHFEIVLPNWSPIVFPSAALLLSLVFMYVSIGYAKRLEASSNTYQQLVELLPKELRRVSINDQSIKHGAFFSKRMSVVICVLMFLGLFGLSIVMLLYYGFEINVLKIRRAIYWRL